MKTQEEMNLVFRTAAEFAMDQLAKHGEFVPFAVAVPSKGALRMISLGEDQVQPDGAANLLALRNILAQGAKKNLYRCLAVASDVRVRMHDTGEVVDVVRVEIEHVQANAAAGMLPYKLVGKELQQPIDPYFEDCEGGILVRNDA